MRDFRRYGVWEKAHLLTLDVYLAAAKFPAHEQFGLRSQLQRASSSIGLNISEGCGFESDAEFGRFVRIASGSASELEYGLLLARDLKYLSPECHQGLEARTQEVKRMLFALAKTLRSGA